MNVANLYWDMLLKNPSKVSEGAESIFQNLVEGKIIGFNKKNRTEFLSNFYPSTITYETRQYSTVEHAYQASKTLEPSTRELIRKSKTPADAKKLGRAVVLRSDWHEVRVDIMRSLIKDKFENPFLRHLLIMTNGLTLVNENRWNDKFWGVCNGIGENWLGKILEEVRDEAISEVSDNY